VKGALLPVMPDFDVRHVVRNGILFLSRPEHLFGRHKKELGLRINEFSNQPRTGHTVDFDSFPRDPFHIWSSRIQCNAAKPAKRGLTYIPIWEYNASMPRAAT